MPLPTISVPAYPNVPDVPGVPSVARLIGANLPLPVQELADGIGLTGILTQPLWGLYETSGASAVVADSVFAVEFQRDYKIADYRMEQGAFASYNKVATPFSAKLTFLIGGGSLIGNLIKVPSANGIINQFNTFSGEAGRTAFLAQLDVAISSLTLYTIVTPEVQYASANVTHYDYQRTGREGVTLMQVDVFLEEVRVTGTTLFSNTQSSNGATTVSGGIVQTIPVTVSQLPPITATGVH